MKINFILPKPFLVPTGGYRIVYEYANRLALAGHNVTVYHSLILPGWRYDKDTLLSMALTCLRQEWPQTFIPNWFSDQPLFSSAIIPEINNLYVRDADIVVATAWATAQQVNELAADKGNKFYLIQGEESIGGAPAEQVHDTYHFGMGNIVVSKWLKAVIEHYGATTAAYIPNALDFSLFHLVESIETRDPYSVAMMYHTTVWKGSDDGIQALILAKRHIPELKVTLFSTTARGEGIPEWIDYVHNPAQSELRNIYNNHALFVSSSLVEGFGLPGAEAMACGCALVTTDSKGVLDYALHEQTALVSLPQQPEALAENLVRLIHDSALRIAMAKQGYEFIQKFSWGRAVQKMENLFKKSVYRDVKLEQDIQLMRNLYPSMQISRHSLSAVQERVCQLPLDQVGEKPAILNDMAILGLEYRRRFVEQYIYNGYGTRVWQGPFQGMQYFNQPVDHLFCPKVLGTYEQELHEYMIMMKEYSRVVLVGCDDGYYAVGLALLLPDTEIIVYDTNEQACSLCVRLAQANGVYERITIRNQSAAEEIITSTFRSGQSVMVVTSGEMDLLEGIGDQGLEEMDILIKTHRNNNTCTGTFIADYFVDTHSIKMIWPKAREYSNLESLQHLGELDKFLAVWEGRGPEPWMWLKSSVGKRI